MTRVNSTKQFGALLRQLRKKRGLGVNQLAGYIGISGAEISRIERGERKKIDPNLLRKLAPKLDVTYEYLMQQAGYLPEKIAEREEIYLTSNNLLADISPEDRKLVLDLIKRLRQK
jgi:transcriptional regulator with XRE-family HTH domain